MTATLTGTPQELKAAIDALAPSLPALASLRGIELQDGHVDLTLRVPALGEVVARVQVTVEQGGT